MITRVYGPITLRLEYCIPNSDTIIYPVRVYAKKTHNARLVRFNYVLRLYFYSVDEQNEVTSSLVQYPLGAFGHVCDSVLHRLRPGREAMGCMLKQGTYWRDTARVTDRLSILIGPDTTNVSTIFRVLSTRKDLKAHDCYCHHLHHSRCRAYCMTNSDRHPNRKVEVLSRRSVPELHPVELLL